MLVDEFWTAMNSGHPYPEGPRIGDAFGELYFRSVMGESAMEIYERDDGYLIVSDVAKYVAPPGDWPQVEQWALERVSGRILDVGCGAGRAAVPLQERGEFVVGLDISPGAVEAARKRGVRRLFKGTVREHAAGSPRYDTFLLLGGNLGLLESAEKAPEFLSALSAMSAPGARIIGIGTDPYGSTNPLATSYNERNRRLGRMAGQLRARIRFEDLATPWFDYLRCSLDELNELLTGSDWRLGDVNTDWHPHYCVELHLRRA
ncbi:class I SAM-dependent methyltransferase [Streptosporangium sp. H16]|uniref:class I SAM-dependent methyltransferase n=1 Tax=Streptosporangium sp. H16 TaxID=3444184 RepID=UPI003F795364